MVKSRDTKLRGICIASNKEDLCGRLRLANLFCNNKTIQHPIQSKPQNYRRFCVHMGDEGRLSFPMLELVRHLRQCPLIIDNFEIPEEELDAPDRTLEFAGT